MYCYTMAYSLQCVLRELIMWTDISSEHPIFVKTVAKLSRKNLPKNISEELKKLSKSFEELNVKAKEQLVNSQRMMTQQVMYGYMNQGKILLNEFGRLNRVWIGLIKDIMKYGRDDKVADPTVPY